VPAILRLGSRDKRVLGLQVQGPTLPQTKNKQTNKQTENPTRSREIEKGITNVSFGLYPSSPDAYNKQINLKDKTLNG